ncbi:patatin-like phospholipase family protein [Allobaculum stercoricanis]|uniref:patatin-like phospholipase family protein n=1 Tax=Allobaculum stercoricanis TaxID=174709 RepID=UPI00248DB6FE|nr:patatin family protein [Allobaculum stercoricanis]
MTSGLLLEGGAMRGLYTAGVMDVLLKHHIEFDEVMGVSAGALFGMNYKSKQIGRVLRYNKKYITNKEYMGFYSLLTTGNIMNKNFCFNKLVNELDPVDFETYSKSKENFYAVVTNMESGQAEYILMDDLKNPDQLEYLRASGSMPFVSKPICVQGNQYLDGGIADSIPIEKMMSMGCDKIVLVLTRPENYRKTKTNTLVPRLFYHQYPNLVDTINNRYIAYNKQLDLIEQLEQEGKIFVIRPSRLVKMKRVEKDPDKLQEMYDLGVSDMNRVLAQLFDYLNIQKSDSVR